jgi:hypothetical protein
MTRRALTVLLVLTAPSALLGVIFAVGMVAALADHRFFSLQFYNLAPLAIALIWVAALVGSLRLRRPGMASGPAGQIASIGLCLLLGVGILLTAAWAGFVYLLATTD